MSTHQYILAQADRAPDRGAERGRPRLRYVTYTHYSQEWTSQLHSHTCTEQIGRASCRERVCLEV